MNFSLFTCDRTTHLKIVVVALTAAILVAVAGVYAHVGDASGMTAAAKPSSMVVKAGKPAVYSTRGDSAIR
jgi:hypothetical protein